MSVPTDFPMPRWIGPQPERTQRYLLDSVPHNGNREWNHPVTGGAAKQQARSRKSMDPARATRLTCGDGGRNG